MTIGTPIWSFGSGDILRETAMGEFMPLNLVVAPNTTARCIAFPPGPTVGANKALGYVGFFTIAPGFVMTTGITVYISTTDDGAFPGDLSNTAVFGVAVRKVTAANANMGTTGTETTATVTMAAASGTFVQTAMAITNANMNSAGAGDAVCIRVRRIATSTSDLVLGRVLMTPSILVTDT